MWTFSFVLLALFPFVFIFQFDPAYIRNENKEIEDLLVSFQALLSLIVIHLKLFWKNLV